MAINEKHSFKDYTGQDLTGLPASEFNDSTVKGSCFYQEWVKGDPTTLKDVFPAGVTGLTLERCNLDNVKIPAGASVKGGTNKRIRYQNDRDDWEVNGSDEPVEPLNKKQRELLGISTLPLSIPTKEMTQKEYDDDWAAAELAAGS